LTLASAHEEVQKIVSQIIIIVITDKHFQQRNKLVGRWRRTVRKLQMSDGSYHPIYNTGVDVFAFAIAFETRAVSNDGY